MSEKPWYRGETIDFELTVATDGIVRDLDAATTIELQLKTAPGADDPPLVSLGLGTGITRRTQTGTDLGKADVQVPYTALDDVPAGDYWMDVVVLFADGTRKVVVKPRLVPVRDVVNQP